MTTNQAPKRALHFETKSTPRFGRGVYSDSNPPKDVISSPFFWWFKFLQLNKDYQETTIKNGVGKCSDLFKDFGDVRTIDFKSWWRDHSHLFAVEPTKYRLLHAKSRDDLAPFDSTEAVNVVVPLNWDQKSLKKYFATLLNNLGIEQGKRGPRVGDTTAKYSLGSRWNSGAMESAYNVFIARQDNMDKGAKETKKAQHKGEISAKYKVAWADIAISAKLKLADGMKAGKVNQSTAEKRRILTIIAKRHYLKAEQFIESAATAKFPSIA